MSWFKRPSRPSEDEALPRQVGKILDRYGPILERKSADYLDVTLLPLQKLQMKAVLKAAWLSSASEDQRNAIEVGWAALSRFQPGIGPTGLSMPEADTSRGNLKTMEHYLRVSRTANAEMESDMAELREFTRRQAAQERDR